MANIDFLDSPYSVKSVIVNAKRQSQDSHPRARFTRRQVIDVSILLDALIVFASFALAMVVYVEIAGGGLRDGASYTLVGVFAGLAHYVVTRTDRGSSQQLKPSTLWQVLRLLMITFAAIIVMGYALKQAEMHSRLWLGLSFAIAWTMIAIKNRILNVLIDRGLLREFVAERIALFGDGSIAGLLKTSLQRESDDMCRISIYDAEHQAELGRLLADGLNNEFDRVIFCLPSGQLVKLKELVSAINFLPARFDVCLAQTELQLLRSVQLTSPGQILISLDDGPQNDWSELFKRVMDLSLGCMLLLLAAPVMMLAAIAIKLDSSGPIFFRQRRHGWNHSVISVWKLRSMTVQEDGESIKQAVENDTRITRVGRFLRRTSIDELPQLFNVLSGEMSLVGPRPHAVAHNLHYSELIASYPIRHKVKPGITGWAQVNGLRGNSENIAKMVARAEADVWYIKHWSILLDLRILLMTPFIVFLQKNAV